MTGTVPSAGDWCHALASELFPICRSITGDGVRQTLACLASHLPGLSVYEVPSGTRCLDWVVPDEWNIRDAYVLAPDGRKLCDFHKHNLHVVGYSEPIDTLLSLDELRPHLYTRPDLPEAIPYVTSYYRRWWGFCLTQKELASLQQGQYRVVIDSTLAPGSLTYGELLIPGETEDEVLLSTYVCHPSLANNELSGPVVATALARWIGSLPKRRYSYRVLFIPETIGSIVYISRNLQVLRERVRAGFIVNCCGDERTYSFLPSRAGNTLSDRMALHVLRHHAGDFSRYTYADRGSDERQYCSPGVDLPIASIMRSKYGTYPEYHTSLDDMTLITPAGLAGAYEAFTRTIIGIERNRRYRTTVLGEPNRGARGLDTPLSQGGQTLSAKVRSMMDLLAYCDGNHELLEIADIMGCPIWQLYEIVDLLVEHKILEPST